MPPEYGHLNRQFNFGKYLQLKGHEPTVFAGSFLHNVNIQMINDDSLNKRYLNSTYPFYFIRTLNYEGSRLKRVLAMVQFYRNVMKVAKTIEKPDVVIGSSAHPLTALAAIRLGKKFGVQSIIEIRDLWPESFVAYDIVKRKNPLMALFYSIEKWFYTKADKVIFTMEGGADYIKEKQWDTGNGGLVDLDKVYHINNGVDLEVYNTNKDQFTLNDEDLERDDTFKVVYTGSIKLVNNVKSIVDIAHETQKQVNDKIQFLVYGDGSDRAELERYCEENKIENITFKGSVEKKFIPFILSKSDLNIIHFEQSNLKKYGSSLNKMFDYFASGKPVISDCEFGYDLIKKYECGFVLDNGSPREISNEIIRVSNLTNDEYLRLSANALKAAHDYDFSILTDKLIDCINDPLT